MKRVRATTGGDGFSINVATLKDKLFLLSPSRFFFNLRFLRYVLISCRPVQAHRDAKNNHTPWTNTMQSMPA